MSRDDVEEHIREQLEGPTEITSEDLEPAVCTHCGNELSGEIAVMDAPEQGNESVVYRYRFCSINCKHEYQSALVSGESVERHGEPEILTEEDRAKYE